MRGTSSQFALVCVSFVVSTVVLANDLQHKLNAIDSTLNCEYQQLKETRSPEAAKRLLAEQKKWLANRDTICHLNGLPDNRQRWIDEVSKNPAQARCVVNQTKSRIASLNANQAASPSVVFDFRAHGEIVDAPIRSIVGKSGFELSMNNNNHLCSTFFKDFIEDRNIFHIEPIVETDNYDSSALKSYRAACPRKSDDLRTVWTVPVQDPADSQVNEIPEYANVFIGRDNFKIYSVDLDGSGSEDVVFYYENEMDVKRKTVSPTRVYKSVAPNACSKKLFISFNQFGSPKWTRNGVINYRGRNGIYVMEGYGMDKPRYLGLRFYAYSPEKKAVKLACRYSWPLNRGHSNE